MAEIGKNRLVDLSDAKLQDAKLLLDAGRYGNAYYLAGYAVELMLKAILSGQFKADTFPDKSLLKDAFTHKLRDLIKSCDLNEQLKAKEDSDAEFRAFWQVTTKWTEASRSENVGSDEAIELIEAIGNPEHGVGPWLRSKL